MKFSACFLVIVLVVGLQNLCIADWPGFRGPLGNGTVEDTAPIEWSNEQNVVWKVALPQPGNGSPIVVGGRVLLTCTEDEPGKQRSTYCFASNTGEQLWVKTVEFDQEMPHHKTNPHGSSTPASDGESVVVWHASAGLYCYDLEGKELWNRDLGEFRHMWGYGSSPIIHRGRVFLNSGPGEKSFVAAFDLKTGKTLWQQDEAEAGTVDRREDGAPHGSWSTPVIAQVDGQDQIVVMHPKRVVAYDAESGDIVWSCDGLSHGRGDLAYSSPVIAGDLCFVIGGYKGPMMSIRLDGQGDVTESHRLYRFEDGPQSIGSGVYFDNHVYLANADAGKGLQCVDPKTGDSLWSQRSPAAHWGSLVLCGGRFYVTGQDGTTVVFRPTPEGYEELAKNELGETCNGTPAISNGKIYIRTHEHLYCIGQ
ncbi:MAG: PQQ-like beta-propeller repeat protein [Planctomycetales bacterium]|nr:PQQ-like beta-propeller repeat protein [Planctomycetales bacterium]